jgi:DNA polymerase III epsilon subunit-like protein
MYLPNFRDGFDRLVAFDAETTGKRTPDAEFIRKRPFAWRAPGIIIEVGFVEMLREGEGWRMGETWSSRVNPDGPIDPEATKIHRIWPADLKNAPRFPTILPKVKDFVGESPIVAHAYKNERDFLDHEFARAKVIQWGESAYAEERYICTQVLFAQLSRAPASRLPRCAIGWCLTAAKETTGTARCLTPTHGCRCAHTAGAPTQAR